MPKRRLFVGKILVAAAITLVFAALGVSAVQNGNKFKARLAPAPPLAPLQRTAVAGIGSATATLSGKKVSVEGTFENLASSATEANLCLGLAAGARGECLFKLMISPGASGTLNGTAELSTEQVEALRKGRFYIQIQSQGAPTGHLLGWLLAEK
ncbi:MAG TPA: CHRD domain-containing protein [Terriglobia bacterium]|nr:CHRD domain-containing protein [Terriglobia bacterium]